MGKRTKSRLMTVTCTFAGCQKTQQVRPSRITKCDGYACCSEHLPHNDGSSAPPPGLVRETVLTAAGAFWGWRDIPLEPGRHASVERARRLALFGLAQAVPAARVHAVVSALIEPMASGRSLHILHVNEMSTGIETDQESGSLEIELPNVVAALCVLLESDQQAGVILRTFTDETVRLPGRSVPLPVKEVRGWLLADGRLQPLTASEIADTYRAGPDPDPAPGVMPPPMECDVRFHDAWHVDLPS